METREERLMEYVEEAERLLTMSNDALVDHLNEKFKSQNLGYVCSKDENLHYARIGATLCYVEAIKNIVRLM